MSFLDLDVGISREGGNVSGTSVELVKIKLKKGTRKTRSDRDPADKGNEVKGGKHEEVAKEKKNDGDIEKQRSRDTSQNSW